MTLPMRLPKTEMASDGRDIFIVIDGVRAAKRGRSSTAEASTWITLVPGWGIRSSTNSFVPESINLCRGSLAAPVNAPSS